MGVVIPQVVTEDRASGALIVDGGLRFDGSKSQYLSRTPGSAGNRTTWTWSCWIKRNQLGSQQGIFHAGVAGVSDDGLFFLSGDTVNAGTYTVSSQTTSQVLRDISSWYHIVWTWDTNNATTADRSILYVNGARVVAFSSASYPSLGASSPALNNTTLHTIGSHLPNFVGENPYAQISQVYFIDGQALDPSYFGYTDPLTNTWRPKKLSSSIAFGTNGFYLPFDGSAPIGQDQSGRGNDWTPVNFGGSNTIEKATGALPILNTDGGGKVARVGVRTDANASSLVLALPLVGIKSDFSNAVNSGTSNKTITSNNAVASSAQSNFYGGSWYFDGTSDSLTISASSDLNLDGMFTVEFWIYLNTIALDNQHPSPITFPGGGQLYLHSSNNYFGLYNGTSNIVTTGNSSVTTGKWYHVAATRDNSNNCRIFLDGVLKSTASSTFTFGTSVDSIRIGSYDGTGGDINGYIQDLRIYKGVAKYTSNFIPASTDPDIVPDSPSGVSYSSNVTLVPSTDGAVAFDGSGDYLSLTDTNNDLDLGGLQASVEFFVYVTDLSATRIILNKGGGASGSPWNTSDGLEWTFVYVSGGAFYFQYNNAGSTGSITASLSLGVWTHVAAATNASNNISLFINGIRVGTATNAVTKPSSRTLIRIGQDWVSQTHSGHISNVHFIKGSGAYDPTATIITVPTGPISSVANTKLLCCKSQSSATASDVTPGTITANGNAAASNFNPFTVNINTQRGKQSGYATLNPLATSHTLKDGNLTADANVGYDYAPANRHLPLTGKYYFEVTSFNPNGANRRDSIGVYDTTKSRTYGSALANSANYNANDGKVYQATNTLQNYSTWDIGDTVGCAFDCDTGKVWFHKNGIFNGVVGTSGEAATLTNNGALAFGVSCGSIDTSYYIKVYVNFGQKPFKFPPPAGFQPLTLANTPRPTIVRPDQYVGISTWTGNSTVTQLNLGFQPDMFWTKDRNNTAGNCIFDSVRGGNFNLVTNTTAAQNNLSGSNGGVVFNKSGIQLQADTSGYTNYNGGGGTPYTYVGWAWKAGGNSNTYNINDVGYATASAAGLTAGTITPTGASVNTKSGFSIITYTGTGSAATISHGLGSVPAFALFKNRGASSDWQVYHQSLGNANSIILQTAAAAVSTSSFNSTSPTSTLFTFGSATSLNSNGATHVGYLWAEIPGFSKFGSYTGNGSADGPMVITGFRPKYILVKASSTGGSFYYWWIYDAARSTYNPTAHELSANTSEAEGSGYQFDLLSNGFKVRTNAIYANSSGATFIYAAFAESPAINLYGAQANAR